MKYDKKSYQKWKRALRTRVLISDFHKEYKVSKIIGQGSFATIYYAIRIKNKKEFAIKAFNK